MARTIDHAALLDFVGKRRKDTGGYGATPRLPATIEDTFQAVAIRLILGEDQPTPRSEPALAGYLARMLNVPWLGIGTTFRLLVTCRVCGIDIDAKGLRSHLAICLDRDASLATTYYVGMIFRVILGVEADIPGPERPVALPDRCAVEDVARYLVMKTMRHERIEEADTLTTWLQRSQSGDGGFGFFPGTTSFIENCHAALAALSLLGARPLDPDNARAFIIGCQTGRGGFARSSRAAPFLDASWHALASLRLLETTEQRPMGDLPKTSNQLHHLILSV